MFGNGTQVVPRRLTVGLELLDLAHDFVPVGFGAAADTAQIGVQIGRVRAFLEYDRAQVLEKRVLVHRVFHLGHT